MHQFAKEGHPVHPGHLDIESDHVGLQFDDLVAGDIGVRRGADHLDLRVSDELPSQDVPHHRRIIHDQYANHGLALLHLQPHEHRALLDQETGCPRCRQQ